MAEKKKYDNIWTKLHLDKLRGNKEFKALWRALRVAGLYGLIKLAEVLTKVELNGMLEVMIPFATVALEKWARERLTALDF